MRGRLEFGNRQGNLRFVARFDSGSTEYMKLKAQTTSSAVITLSNDASNSLQLTWQKVAFSTVELGDSGWHPPVAVECVPIYYAANGILTAIAKCGVDGICQ